MQLFWDGCLERWSGLDGEMVKMKPSWRSWRWMVVKRDTKRLACLCLLCEDKGYDHLHVRREPSHRNWLESEITMILDFPDSRAERKKSCALSCLLYGILLSQPSHTNRNEREQKRCIKKEMVLHRESRGFLFIFCLRATEICYTKIIDL